VRKILGALVKPYELPGGARVSLSASMGVSLFPDNSPDGAALVRHADLAMYSAKQAGKNRHALYTDPDDRVLHLQGAGHPITDPRASSAVAGTRPTSPNPRSRQDRE
jgi:predicted signal transduction protein with EAL and GGDEF domain